MPFAIEEHVWRHHDCAVLRGMAGDGDGNAPLPIMLKLSGSIRVDFMSRSGRRKDQLGLDGIIYSALPPPTSISLVPRNCKGQLVPLPNERCHNLKEPQDRGFAGVVWPDQNIEPAEIIHLER